MKGQTKSERKYFQVTYATKTMYLEHIKSSRNTRVKQGHNEIKQ